MNDIAAGGGGALTVLQSFHQYVRDHDQGNEWIFLVGSDVLAESSNIQTISLPKVRASWLRRLAFDLISGRRLIGSLKPDVVFSLQNTYTCGLNCPQVVYVHQALPFQRVRSFSLWRRDERVLATYQHVIGALIKRSIGRADRAIVQTHWMRDAVLDQVGVSRDRLHSILPDLDDLSSYQFDGTPDIGSFFYPTADHLYKNNECIYAACSLLRDDGVEGFTVTLTVDGPTEAPNVVTVGRIPREQVLRMLSRSTLIFPSYIETYGLPLAEARTLGGLVLAADLPYAREVLDGYPNAYYFDHTSPLQLAALIRRVLTGDIVKARMADVGEVPSRATPTDAWARVVGILEDSTSRGEVR